jgi:archaellum biogenesis protein FlaJ (TadC family)
MKRKLLIGTIVVFGIAAAILMSTLIAGALIAVWIYLVWMVWKKKTDIFHDQMQPELAERRLKRLKAFLVLAGISFAVFIVGVIVHNALYGLSEIEEPASFVIALVGLGVFMIATVGGLVIFLRGRRETTQRNTETRAI